MVFLKGSSFFVNAKAPHSVSVTVNMTPKKVLYIVFPYPINNISFLKTSPIGAKDNSEGQKWMPSLIAEAGVDNDNTKMCQNGNNTEKANITRNK